MSPQEVRQRIRRGAITGHTSGLAPGCVRGRNVPMYRTNVPTTSAGPFHGPLVV